MLQYRLRMLSSRLLQSSAYIRFPLSSLSVEACPHIDTRLLLYNPFTDQKNKDKRNDDKQGDQLALESVD